MADSEGAAAASGLDPRLTPARPDLAARYLQGKVEAARFVEGELREVVAPQAPVRQAPAPDAPLVTEVLKGERVTVYEISDEGWAWVQLASDGYVGFVPLAALVAPGAAATHQVTALRTLVFPSPSIKLPPIDWLPFGARLRVGRIEGALAVTSAGYVPATHLAPAGVEQKDFVAVAERFVGTPYLWGGKTALGIDCSGLVQVALHACGLPCPRDSDMQEAALGTAVASETTLANLQRGDLLFWKGHVGIMRDERMLLHANAFHMGVAIEPAADAVARNRATGSDLTGVRRL